MTIGTANQRMLFGVLCTVGGLARLFHGYLISRTDHWPQEWPKRPLWPRFSLRLLGDLGIVLVGLLVLLLTDTR